MPWSTLEVRWFCPDPPAENGSALEDWFRSRPTCHSGGAPAPIGWAPEPPAWRQDRYLVVPGHDDMGIKWREGRLEIKGREAALGHQVFAPGIEGRCERWLKWSYAGEAIARRFGSLFHDCAANAIVTVEKRRLQRHLRLDPSGVVLEVGLGEERERGIDVELAHVRLAGTSSDLYWTLGFEAFPSDCLSERFAQVVRCFLEACPALPLGADRSMSYPRWLLDFDQSGGGAG